MERTAHPTPASRRRIARPAHDYFTDATAMNLLAADGAVAFACCHCRAVRTATGRWSQGVTPPGARVSHGICPTCLGLYYPGVSPPAPPPLLRGETNGQPRTGAGSELEVATSRPTTSPTLGHRR